MPQLEKMWLLKQAELGRPIEHQEIAEQTGVGAVTISRLMNSEGMTRIDATVADALAKYFGCDYGDLFPIVLVESDEDPKEKAYSTAAA